MRNRILLSFFILAASHLASAQSVDLRVTGMILPVACETQISQPTLSTASPTTPYKLICQPGNNGVLRQVYSPNSAQIDMIAAKGNPGETRGMLSLHQMPASGAHHAYLEVYYY